MNRRVLIGLAALLTTGPGTAPAAATGTIEQHFPAEEPAARARTKWRVVWGIEPHAGGSEVLFIKEAYFARGPGEPEIKVLGDCRIAEIFVPYNYGWRVYDVAAFTFPLVELDPKDLGPACLGSGVLYGKDGKPGPRGFVAKELHDDHVRWMDTTDKTYRGQTLQVWSVMNANNYRYVILYAFRDDGMVNVRLGATANNRYSTQGDWATHIHSGFWRVNLDLGDPFALAVAMVRFNPRDAHTTVEPVVTEKRIKWNPEEYTRLRVTSTRFQNGHAPANYIGYDVVLHTEGSGRHNLEGEEFTHHDFWITRARPLDLRPRDLPTYERGQMLEENRPVFWVQASVLHTPRDEDFGRDGYDSLGGVAITTWYGFDLKPRNFLSSTPLYDRKQD